MSTANVLERTIKKPVPKMRNQETLEKSINDSWAVIAPFWPLKNLIAVNPLKGFEDLPFEAALKKGKAYFQQESLPKPMEAINRETIKWIQAYLDEGQAIIQMPLRDLGLYPAWKSLAIYDKSLHNNDRQKIDWLRALPNSPQQALDQSLYQLKIPQKNRTQFLQLMLTTMQGWASYIKYQNEWNANCAQCIFPANQTDYLCIRVVITCLLWPEARNLITWHEQALEKSKAIENPLIEIEKLENSYRSCLINQLKRQKLEERSTPAAQFVFCIDVRSEPFRKALESTGNYETFGFAGFFGVPVEITNTTTNDTYASCPVLLSPSHQINQLPISSKDSKNDQRRYTCQTSIKKLYRSLKYSFATPFALAEGLGIFSGIWAGIRTLFPNLAFTLKNATSNLIRKPIAMTHSLHSISLEEQCTYAENALRMMGLTKYFAPLVVFCGHGGCTQNNAFASSLDCGACGGNPGCSNARILAAILNTNEVKSYLAKQGIFIPETTQFIGAQHDTTTDEVFLYSPEESDLVNLVNQDLEKARELNNISRLKKMDKTTAGSRSKKHIKSRSQDWAQVRPEWGLAGNAAFIVGPRYLTKGLDLDGRCFLHSYDYSQDLQGNYLRTILTAPMIVAQWINAQYLFSTLDNTSFGAGSKITKNITGKLGVMQGNASDLMTGLPLQSVYSSDKEKYHTPQRLLTIVYSSCQQLDSIIQLEPELKKLFGNGWVQLACIEPKSHTTFLLQRNFTWEKVE